MVIAPFTFCVSVARLQDHMALCHRSPGGSRHILRNPLLRVSHPSLHLVAHGTNSLGPRGRIRSRNGLSPSALRTHPMVQPYPNRQLPRDRDFPLRKKPGRKHSLDFSSPPFWTVLLSRFSIYTHPYGPTGRFLNSCIPLSITCTSRFGEIHFHLNRDARFLVVKNHRVASDFDDPDIRELRNDAVQPKHIVPNQDHMVMLRRHVI